MEHLAVMTGASSGIGFELAKYAAGKDYDVIVAADEAEIETAADKLRANGAEVIAVQADLATREGVAIPTTPEGTLTSRPRWWIAPTRIGHAPRSRQIFKLSNAPRHGDRLSSWPQPVGPSSTRTKGQNPEVHHLGL